VLRSSRHRLQTRPRASSTAVLPSLLHQEEQLHNVGSGDPRVVAVKALVDTLVASQLLVPPRPALQQQQQQQQQSDDTQWLRYFAGLGNSVETVDPDDEVELVEEKPETLQAVDQPESIQIKDEEDPHSKTNKNLATRLTRELAVLIQRRNVPQSLKTYDALRSVEDHEIHPDIVRALFFLVSRRNPLEAYSLLNHHQQLTFEQQDQDLNAYADMYERVCDSIRYLSVKTASKQEILKLVKDVIADVSRLDSLTGKRRCYPALISSLIEQNFAKVGKLAKPLYKELLELDDCYLDRNPGYCEHLLSRAKFFRHNDLPYAEILQRAVELGQRPNPDTVILNLEILFPYTNVKDTRMVLTAIMELQKTTTDKQYVIDISTLELIGAMAAQRGDEELVLMVWDLVDLFGYQPTEAIFEDTIVAFASNPETYTNAFTVLSHMEEYGMEPSRALIRSLSVHLRYENDFAPATI
jgi:hypothetical protein